ncbi:hypothetical protein [Thermicanus aegyptius]|uniref:hypothetical protein n=1 Tax=Thermicanus aegyptius TaxID=94009 RepID=UPI00040AB076|nr:hypothetical protein [Thermicanus aegyptius]
MLIQEIIILAGGKDLYGGRWKLDLGEYAQALFVVKKKRSKPDKTNKKTKVI